MLLIVGLVGASEEKLSAEIYIKDSFGPGETISYTYRLMPREDINLTLHIITQCPDMPSPIITEEELKLRAGVSEAFNFSHTPIKEFYSPQVCVEELLWLERDIILASRSYRIDTTPGFELKALVCSDEGCTRKSRIFNLGDKIYFDYSSTEDNLELQAYLRHPDNRFEAIDLPALRLMEFAGSYQLQIKAQKDGYREAFALESFIVVRPELRIEDLRICGEAIVCNNDEDLQNCPQYCADEFLGEGGYLKYLIILLLLILAVFLRNYIARKR